MSKRVLILSIVLWALPASLVSSSGAALEDEFRNPPDPARPWVYWINMDGHLTKEGITADFESMKTVGIGGMIHMDVDVGVPRGKTPFMSRKWQENFKHAVLECERLGLEFTTITGPGWTGTGGPWIKAHQSMQHLVPSSVNVKGPGKFNAILPKPQPRVSGYHRKQTPQMRKALADFYEDVAVYAFPRRDAVIKDVDEKALFIRNPYTSMRGVRPYLPSPVSYPACDKSKVIDPKKIIDLTDRLQPDGRLKWDVPRGQWTILRMGRRSSGANTRPAPAAGLGFESNKLDKKALEAHFKAYFDPLLKQIGPRAKDRKTGFTGLDADSWEMSSQNWTPGFRQEFKKRRGYDPWLYFPAYSGRVVGSREITERFLWDVRMTCQEMLLENHIAHMKKLCHDRGLKLAIEPYDMNPTVDLDLGSYADVPMGEFWHNGFNSAWSCIEAASIGHIMGKPIVAAEAFTSSATFWKKTPWTLKDQGDWAFAAGINRFVIVTFAHQPWTDREPGMMFGGYGLHWERTQTFWPLLSGYHQYLARCSHLLQQGVSVADILYLTPEGAPHVFRGPASALDGSAGRLPDKKGYGFDGCSPRILLNRAKVKDGLIVFPGGTSYRLMVLARYETMTPKLLAKIEAMVKAGATIVGSPSLKSPSLSNYPACDGKLQSLATKLWGGLKAPDAVTCRTYGRGKIYWGGPGSKEPKELYCDYDSTAAVLKKMGVSEDFTASGPVRYAHRRTRDREIYFVSNRSDKPLQADCTFRAAGGRVELWNPINGERRDLRQYKSDKGLTTIPMEFAPRESFFVVFPRGRGPKSDKSVASGVNFPKAAAVATLKGSWEVSFDPKRGGPKKVTFDALSDWTRRKEDSIKYYSGIAIYRKSFDRPQGLAAGARVYLDLGTVHEMARVRLNGKDLGVIWCAPWRVDISRGLKAGKNQLEIEVANLWPNRLIGDAAKPQGKRITWTIRKHPYKAGSKLLPSGLIGPVTVSQVK
jgi:hypothetical protein